MGKEFDKAINLKSERHFSKTKCFIEFINDKVVLYYGKEEYEFNNLAQMYEWLAAKHERFYIYTNNFNLIYKAYKDFLSNAKDSKKNKALINGNAVYGVNLYNIVSFRDMKYKFGSDKFTTAAAIEIINKDESDEKSSFNSNLGRKIQIDAIKKDFPPIQANLRSIMMNETPKGAIILANKRKEFKDVHCYDVCSAYVACLLEGKLPYKFQQVGKIEEDKEYFVKFKFKNLKAKNPQMLTLYLTNRQEGRNICPVNKRIVAAEEYCFYGFLNELWIINQFYNYDSYEIINQYEVIFKELPESSRLAIQKIYDDKLAAKGQLDYDGFKQIVNRIYGFFITKKRSKFNKKEYTANDKNVPYQFGIWIIYRQRLFMTALIAAVGVNHVVSAHTDGVKFDCNADEIVDKINLRRGEIYKDVGQWKKEEVFDRCFYFSNTVAKYEIDGVVGMKHGGISQEDIDEFLENRTYDEINEETEFYITDYRSKELVCEEDRTYISKRKILSSLFLMDALGGIDNE